MNEINLANIRQAFGNSVYNWKVHEVSAELLYKRIFIVKIINIVLVSLVLCLLAIDIFSNHPLLVDYNWALKVASVLTSVLEIIFLIILLSFGFDEKAVQHKKTALNFRSVRDRYINLISDVLNGTTNAEIIQRRDALLCEFQTVCNLAPQTERGAYVITRKRLKPFTKRGLINLAFSWVIGLFKTEEVDEQDFTITDEEIDRFLPEKLQSKRA